MNLLFQIIYAAHASGTHHKLALDALRRLDGPDAEGWRRLFLAHAERYLEGSKAPDNTFKDFKNHVLHVRDGYWGGAADLAGQWYGRLVDDLRAARWPEAVYAAGVLSHYIADPVHPFHTGQSEAENNVHRAVEWSISRSYNDLKRMGEAQFAGAGPAPGQGTAWLHDLVAAGADTANRQYEALMVHYDIDRGIADPPSGLDATGRRIIAELIIYASGSIARVLERAVAEAKVAPPAVSLTFETVLATLKIPLKLVARRMEDAADRREVERMYDELRSTGRLEHTLGEAERVVRELRAAEVAPAESEARAKSRASFIARAGAARPASDASASPTSKQNGVVTLVTLPQTHERRSRLAAGDPVERAPSIGPRTAERLERVGIVKVADLLAGDPARVAAALDTRHIDAGLIGEWQDQARLMIAVPGLRGGDAQLLVGAGLRTADAIAHSAPEDVCARVLAFAATADGQRALRDGEAPDIARIKSWLETVRAGLAA